MIALASQAIFVLHFSVCKMSPCTPLCPLSHNPASCFHGSLNPPGLRAKAFLLHQSLWGP